MQVHHHPRFLPQDSFVRQRTAVYTTVSSRARITIVASSGPDFMYIERTLFRLMWNNEAVPEYNYSYTRIPWFFGRAGGLLLAGQRFAEVEPWYSKEGDADHGLDSGAPARRRRRRRGRCCPSPARHFCSCVLSLS